MIQGLGVQVEHIPGGCTYLCQPVDIGVNKPFKVRIRKLWEQWMVAEGLATNTTSPPTRKHIADWAIQAINEIPEQLVRNAWRHGEYAYYLPTVPGPPTWDAAPPPLDGSDGDNNDMDGDENIAEQHE
jgi:DDE superfamily endonuclease